jgi:hypothetical protein
MLFDRKAPVSRTVAVIAPLRLPIERATDAIVALGAGMFPTAVGIDGDRGLALSEAVAVELGPVGPDAWTVTFSPVGHGRLLPEFTARLALVDVGGGGVQLVLSGSYTPPFGMLGVIVDYVWARRLVQRSISRFLHEAATALEREALLHCDTGPIAIADYPTDFRRRLTP